MLSRELKEEQRQEWGQKIGNGVAQKRGKRRGVEAFGAGMGGNRAAGSYHRPHLKDNG